MAYFFRSSWLLALVMNRDAHHVHQGEQRALYWASLSIVKAQLLGTAIQVIQHMAHSQVLLDDIAIMTRCRKHESDCVDWILYLVDGSARLSLAGPDGPAVVLLPWGDLVLCYSSWAAVVGMQRRESATLFPWCWASPFLMVLVIVIDIGISKCGRYRPGFGGDAVS